MLHMSRSTEHLPSAVLVEDEPALCDELRDTLATLWPELTVVATAADGHQAIAAIERHRPDIVFLDIQIPGPSGLDVARRIGKTSHIVFVTAYNEHAISAFEKGAVDYILKPMSVDRLALTVHRLRERLGDPVADMQQLIGLLQTQLKASQAPSRHLRWVTATVGKSTRFIDIDDVVYFQSDQKYTRVVLADSEFLIKKTLKELLAELDPEQFWQTHRSTVVNAFEIAAMEPDFGGRLTMRLRERRELLPVSETFATRYRQL